MNRSAQILVIGFMAIAVSTLGCTNKLFQTTRGDGSDIFSNRPIDADADLYVVTLEKPSLLKIARKTDSGWEIPAVEKSQLLEEQARFETKLKNTLPTASIVYRYRMTVNGFAVFATPIQVAEIKGMPGVQNISPATAMGRPKAESAKQIHQLGPVTSVNFIGADVAHARGFLGQGMKVGIIDTGIDYTHAMLGGRGSKEEFLATHPDLPTPSFPNAKVVGGIDLVGTSFNAASPYVSNHLPRPDGNPLDEAGHGTHVAGTVAGIGDGVNTYSGVAPEAKLYALKVFGKDGSTSDAVVVAAFEYAADPNGDLNPDDQLDVVNLSLGGGFGSPQILYTEAVKNLSDAGTMVIAAAGNSGPVDYIVGAPSTSDEALSVAASIDGSEHNWQFRAVRFITANDPNLLVKAIEGPVSKAIDSAGEVSGSLVDIGLADSELSEEVKAKLNGKIALIVRGKVSFLDKLKRAADGGAIGAVVYNSDPGEPIAMGGDGSVDIPAIMIPQALGQKFLTEMTTSEVRVEFKTTVKIQQPDLIDTITSFSSKGPRSEDNMFKPEIAAPGLNIISAAMGEGTGGVPLNGTSMATPHMAGVIALIKQSHPGLSSRELKSLVMSTSKFLSSKGVRLPMTLQGSGRIQVNRAVAAEVVFYPASVSLGLVQVGEPKTLHRTLTVRNLSDRAVEYLVTSQSGEGISVKAPASISLRAKEQITIELEYKITNDSKLTAKSELESTLILKRGDEVVAHVPALAVRSTATMIQATGTATRLSLTNESPVVGFALPFNLIGEDDRKPASSKGQEWKSSSCDLESAGYRLLSKATPQGSIEVIQFAFKLQSPVTHWLKCELSVLIDADEDGNADQELAGVSGMSIEGMAKFSFATVLLDSQKARAIRLNYEKAISVGQMPGQEPPSLTYEGAVLAVGQMAPFESSTIAVIEAPLSAIAKTKDGKINVKLASLATQDDNIEADDFLGLQDQWLKLPSQTQEQPFFGMQELVPVKLPRNLNMQKGSGVGKLVLYYPRNDLGANPKSQAQIFE